MQKAVTSLPTKLAVVGLACRYPDAETPDDLFLNSIAQRRSFRKIPPQRLSDAYFDETGQHPDKAYNQQAAVLKNFQFDRAKFKIPLASYQNTDMTHWLALTVAAEAINDVRFRKNHFQFDHNAVRVVIGNTLTGEFSRANTMRLRWPYVRGIVARQLQESGLGLSDSDLRQWLKELEHRYKHPFPEPNEDFLSGGLANTIAGRICNYFDFRGGGYTVDGACSSSLLAVTDACNALVNHDADVVLAGGVDLSIDPFELIGFSRTLALAKDDMRVYDEFSQGFWPGEGCGFVVLMRYEDAIKNCSRIYGVIRGWGVSSDGHGGLTRPEVDGQKLALQRCYERAGYGIETVTYFEGHGTGTKVGDEVELTALLSSREEADTPIHEAVISSVKANIGHTKAAAGLAGLIRVLKCLQERVLPPTTACLTPHGIFSRHPGNLSPATRAALWAPEGMPRRAGLSAMGFGGVNTHITIEEADAEHQSPQSDLMNRSEWERLGNIQDAELFLFSFSTPQDLAWTINYVADFASRCSLAELTDLAAEMARRATRGALSRWRAATVARTPAELVAKLQQMARFLETFEGGFHLDKEAGFSIFGGTTAAKIGFLFSGQGAPVRDHGGAMEHRLEGVRSVFARPHLGSFQANDDTDYAQVAITMANLAGLRAVSHLGITADLAIGHSLGELSALHWAECVTEDDLIKIVRARGAAMTGEDAQTSGAMLAVAMSGEQVTPLLEDIPDLYVANLNSARQTVVSGSAKAVTELARRLKEQNIRTTVLALKQAFHSPYMQKSAALFKATLQDVPFAEPKGRLISTVTGHEIDDEVDWSNYLCEQIISPVRFQQAIETADDAIDLFIEIGPGGILTHLTEQISGKPALSMDVGNASLAPFLNVVGAAFVASGAPEVSALFDDRYVKPFNWGVEPRFLANQCELNDLEYDVEESSTPSTVERAEDSDIAAAGGDNIMESLREATAAQVGLPKWTIQNDSRMLADLHLNSIAVSKIVADVARSVGLPALIDPTQFSNSSIIEISSALEELLDFKHHLTSSGRGFVHGVRPWVRYFSIAYEPATTTARTRTDAHGSWRVLGAETHQDRALCASIVAQAPGDGVLLLLDVALGDDYPDRLLDAAHRCLQERISGEETDLAVIQTAPIAGGFLKSFSLENPAARVRLFTLSGGLNDKMAESVAERLGEEDRGFMEFRIGDQGDLETPLLRHIPKSHHQPKYPIDDNDLVLVSGGGKGISAECGYQLALKTGCALLIIGRSDLATDEEVARNIERLRQAGLRAAYFRADVTDRAAVETAIGNALANWGMSHLAGIIHGAGINHPNRVDRLDSAAIRHTLSAKIDGFHNLLACVDARQLKLLVTFSSIIGRIGMHGEADYALANERLSLETEAFQRKNPHVLCRALEWSIWSGTGMGQSLGRVDALMEQGIAPITIDNGVAEFLHLISNRSYPTSLIVTSRFARPDTVPMPRSEPSRYRFIETVEVDYPGIELVAQCRLHTDTDLYLGDHMLDGTKLFPAVLVLEVIAEAVEMLLPPVGDHKRLVIEDIEFAKAIVVPDAEEGLVLRVAALVEQEDRIVCVLRCSDTGFQMDHVRATCMLVAATETATVTDIHAGKPLLPEFDVDMALYKTILFQKGRFQQVAGYRHVEASGCSAQLAARDDARWFDDSVRDGLLLGDPGIRDSVLHGVQACMPHRTLIPVSVARVEVGQLRPNVSYRLTATEVEDKGDELIFDLVVTDDQDIAVEKWHHIAFRKFGMPKALRFDAPVLLAPFMERYIKPLIPGMELVVRMQPEERQPKVNDEGNAVPYRPDGKPSPMQDGHHRSNAYRRGWQLSVSSNYPVACDLEWLAEHDDTDWPQLLDADRYALAELMAKTHGEDISIAAARVWTMLETVKKLGLPAYTAITLDPASQPHCVVCRVADARLYSAMARTIDHSVAVASLAVVSTATQQRERSEDLAIELRNIG